MADLEFGLRRGLSAKVDYNALVNDQARHYQLLKQKQIEQENKAKLFADDFDYNNAINSFDNPIIKENARKQISSIGTFIRDNPGWEKDVNKRIQYKQMVRELKDNPELNRGLQSDSNYKLYQKDLAEKSKNPQVFDADAYGAVANEWDNYLKYGNQRGQEAAATEGRKPFVYTQPQDLVDLASSGLEKGNKFNQFDIKPIKGGGLGSYQEVPNEEALSAVATDEYTRNKRQYDREYAIKGFKTPFDYAKANIRSGIKTKVDYGNFDLIVEDQKFKNKAAQAKPVGVWSKDIVNVDKGTVNGAILKSALGATPPLKIRATDGSILDLSGHEVDYTGRNTYMGEGKQHGVKHFEVSAKLSNDEAIGNKVLIKNYKGDLVIAPKWRGKAYMATEKNAKGEDVDITIMREFVPFDINNATYQGIYDQKATISKFQEAPEEGYQAEEQPTTVIQNGITYTLNPNTGKYE